MPTYPTGLQRHPKSGVYYLRRRIPTDILPCYPGKIEITFSLRTKNHWTAREKYSLEASKLTAEWERHRQRLADQRAHQQLQTLIQIDSLTPEVIDAICLHVEATSLGGDEARREDGNYTVEEIEEYMRPHSWRRLHLVSYLDRSV